VHENVGVRAQREQRAAVGVALEVERDAALAAVHLHELRTHAAMPRRRRVAHDVAVRRLDLDHVGTESGQHVRRPRPGDNRREIENAHAVQRPAARSLRNRHASALTLRVRSRLRRVR
jgi:hypothetical protein